jgi:hypothetical protein
MEKSFPIYSPQFFTATIHEWQHALADDKHKDIIISAVVGLHCIAFCSKAG